MDNLIKSNNIIKDIPLSKSGVYSKIYFSVAVIFGTPSIIFLLSFLITFRLMSKTVGLVLLGFLLIFLYLAFSKFKETISVFDDLKNRKQKLLYKDFVLELNNKHFFYRMIIKYYKGFEFLTHSSTSINKYSRSSLKNINIKDIL